MSLIFFRGKILIKIIGFKIYLFKFLSFRLFFLVRGLDKYDIDYYCLLVFALNSYFVFRSYLGIRW